MNTAIRLRRMGRFSGSGTSDELVMLALIETYDFIVLRRTHAEDRVANFVDHESSYHADGDHGASADEVRLHHGEGTVDHAVGASRVNGFAGEHGGEDGTEGTAHCVAAKY